jgi:hypothetical protein
MAKEQLDTTDVIPQTSQTPVENLWENFLNAENWIRDNVCRSFVTDCFFYGIDSC